jgi:Protein of unknown function (DUF4244)
MHNLIRRCRQRGDTGFATAESAVLILVGVAFALVLLAVIRSAAVRDALASVVMSAFEGMK